METRNPTEQRFVEALNDLLAYAPSRVPALFAEVLRERDARVLLAVVGLGDFPMVETTVTLDDITSQTVTQVMTRLLPRVGIPREAVPMTAATVGTVAARWIAQRRAAATRQAQQPVQIPMQPQAQQQPPASSPGQSSAAPQGTPVWGPKSPWAKK